MSPLLTDDAGTAHEPADAGARVLSLVPSLTELVFDLGLADRLVGRTNFCVHPVDAIGDIPSVGGTKQVDMDKVRAIAPTHALVNIDETPKDLADELGAMGIRVVVTHPIAVADNRKLFRLIGSLFGAEQSVSRLEQEFDAALKRLSERAHHWSPRKVLYLIWRKPWMSISADTYIAAMLAEAKMSVVEHASDARYPEVDINTGMLEGVDLVLFSTEPFPFQEKHLQAFRDKFPAHAEKAKLIDAEMVSWYGNRAVAGLDYLATFADEVNA